LPPGTPARKLLLGELPDLDVSPADVIAELESARSAR
jgi:hypothetical protein